MGDAARGSAVMGGARWVAATVAASGLWLAAPVLGAEPSSAAPDSAEANAAAEDDVEERAQELFQQSKEHYRAGRFAQAIELLNQAYALVPEPVLQYNLGRAYDGAGNLEQAVAAYERYLAEEASVKDRGAIESRIATLRRQLRERAALEQDAAKARAHPAQPAGPPQLDTADEPSSDTPAIAPWVIAGVGVLGIGAGVVLGVVAKQKASDAEAAAVNRSALETLDKAQNLATAANVAFVVGGVVAAAGLTWGIVDVASSPAEPKHARRIEIGLGLGGGQLTVQLD